MLTFKQEGKCVYCGQTFARNGISRHLEAHFRKMEAVKGKKSFHLKVEAGPYFLHLLMDGDSILGELDDFLRAIWVDCCWHMSQFSRGRWGEDLDFELEADQIFDKGVKLWYAYDFGSTTELEIKCISVHPFPTDKCILLLSRNERLDIPCDRCKQKPARNLCTAHWDGSDKFFCEDCGEIHLEECEDAEDGHFFPVVNSPRMGVCGYDGGTIDLERD